MPEPYDTPATRVVELVVNLDDATGELLGHVIDQLLRAGALDCWATPITMKKGRPAVMLSALTTIADKETLAVLMLRETGSFGVRVREWDRLVLDRDWHERDTRLGKVKLKAGALRGRTITVKPEADDVARLAKSTGVTVAEAQRAAVAAADTLIAELNASAEEGGRP